MSPAAFPTLSELNDYTPSMSASERALNDLLLTPRPTWTPLPGPQTEAWLTEADATFYGGSGGSGKTDLLLGLAGTAHRKSLILRREFPQLREIIERSHQLFAPIGGTYNGSTNLWRLPDKRLIEFGAVQYDMDVTRYQGRPHDFLGFDELANFSERQYRFLSGWVRTTVPGQRTRIVGAGNPPTDDAGGWVIRHWAAWLDGQHPRPALPGELRWYAMVDGQEIECESGAPFDHKGERIRPLSRTFIPGRLSDNPYLERTGYRAQLQSLPEPLRSQILYGDFSAGTEDDPWQAIPTEWVRAAQARWTDEQPDMPLTALGVDVARGGKDKTVLSRRYGRWFAPLERHPGAATPDGPTVAGLVLPHLAGGGYANIDGIGVGASVYDFCVQRDANVQSVIFSEAAPWRDRTGTLGFVNLRAAAYWGLREALDPSTGDDLALPPDPELLSDLCAAHWSMRLNGIQIESKEDIIKRIGRSPDAGDAAVLAALAPREMTVFRI